MRYSSFDNWYHIGDLVDPALEDLIGSASSPAGETGEKGVVEESNSTISHETERNNLILQHLARLEIGIRELREILRGGGR